MSLACQAEALAKAGHFFNRFLACRDTSGNWSSHRILCLRQARDALSAHYAEELREPFATAGLCFYRDGRDSVAWHGDRIGRGAREDTMVAIVSVGAPRDLVLRPVGGGPSVRRALGHGDLIVMGGSCQRTWEHAIPKSARAVGPRISVQFRPHGVR